MSAMRGISEPGEERKLRPSARTTAAARGYDERANDATVFVVDPDDAVRETVEHLAETMNLRCESYASGGDFISAYEDSRPGCLVLELKIPGVSGLQIQEHLLKQGTGIPVLFLAEQTTVSFAVRAMRAGAIHFLEKPVREHELWDAIQEALEIDRQRRHALLRRREIQQQVDELTSRERRILEMTAEGISKKAMAKELDVCMRTVDLARSQLMKKLRLGSITELVHFAIYACDGHANGHSLPGNRLAAEYPAYA
jgi:FixJ family two-component response regulator